MLCTLECFKIRIIIFSSCRVGFLKTTVKFNAISSFFIMHEYSSSLYVKGIGPGGPFFTHKVELDTPPVLLRDKVQTRLEGLIFS